MFTNKFKLYILAAGALTVIAVLRIAATYRATSQGFDEPCHVAAAIEFLDKGTYTLDPVHPPLSRIAIGLPLYLAGERFPKWSESDPRIRNYNEVGNSVLYGDGHYLRNLSLARAAVLPFFIICAAIVFLWTRREFGNSAALIAVMFFTTVPTVLAFAGLAYSDMTTACMQAAAIFAYVIWMERPSLRSTVLLGIAVGLALASKLTSVLFLFSAGALITTGRWYLLRRAEISLGSKWLKKTVSVLALSAAVLWSCYGFELGRVRESMGLSIQCRRSSISLVSSAHSPDNALSKIAWYLLQPCYTALQRPGRSTTVRHRPIYLDKHETGAGGISLWPPCWLRLPFHFWFCSG
jgi:hypothetical protein